MRLLGDALLWTATHTPLTFALLAAWCGGWLAVAYALGWRPT